MDELKEKYKLFIAELEKIEVPCTVNLLAKQIVVETGRHTPESLDDAVYQASRKVGLQWGINVSSCADMTGYDIIESERIRGNKNKYKD